MSTEIAKLTRRVVALEDAVSVLMSRLEGKVVAAPPSQRDAAGQRSAEMNKAMDDATHAAHEIDQHPDHPR